jgi:hypothetical protein
MLQPDGTIAIAWHADGYETVLVRARHRPSKELEGFAREVADVALLERSLADLGTALRRRFPGAFDLHTVEPASGSWRVVVSFHPPRREPNPDPG